MIKNYIKQGYEVLAEDADTLEFKQINITEEIEKYAIYEIDHINKVIYLESIKPNNCILIVSNDDLELPLCTVKNINEAAQFMQAEATHVYRAYRRAGRPSRLAYKDYILIKM